MKRHRSGPSGPPVLNRDGHAIGIDIGATGIRAAVITPRVRDGRPTVSVTGLGRVSLPEGAVVKGVVVDQAAVARALKHLWKSSRFDCRKVILGITNQQVVVRDLQMPVLPAEQLAKALPFRAREIVAMPLENALIDFVPLGGPNPDKGMQDGLLVAAPRQPVVAAVRAVEKAGLKVVRIDLSSLAALRSAAHQGLATEAVVDMGAQLTNIVIHHLGVPKVVRTVAHGGEELTRRLSDRLDISMDEAELAKAEIGLTGSDARVSAALADAIRPMLAEIRSSIQYLSVACEGVLVERISLTGGGAALTGIDIALAEEIGVPVGVVNPDDLVHDIWGPKQARHASAENDASAVSVGLAMGAAA